MEFHRSLGFSAITGLVHALYRLSRTLLVGGRRRYFVPWVGMTSSQTNELVSRSYGCEL